MVKKLVGATAICNLPEMIGVMLSSWRFPFSTGSPFTITQFIGISLNWWHILWMSSRKCVVLDTIRPMGLESSGGSMTLLEIIDFKAA